MIRCDAELSRILQHARLVVVSLRFRCGLPSKPMVGSHAPCFLTELEQAALEAEVVAVDPANCRHSAVDKASRAISVRCLPTLISGWRVASHHALNKHLEMYKPVPAAAQDAIGIAHCERRRDAYHFDPHYHLESRFMKSCERVVTRRSSATEPFGSATASVAPPMLLMKRSLGDWMSRARWRRSLYRTRTNHCHIAARPRRFVTLTFSGWVHRRPSALVISHPIRIRRAQLLERENRLPIVLHADDRPIVLLCLSIERRSERTNLGIG